MGIEDQLKLATAYIEAERRKARDAVMCWVVANTSASEHAAIWRDLRHHINPAWAPGWTPADALVTDAAFKRLPPALEVRVRRVGDRRAD